MRRRRGNRKEEEEKKKKNPSILPTIHLTINHKPAKQEPWWFFSLKI